MRRNIARRINELKKNEELREEYSVPIEMIQKVENSSRRYKDDFTQTIRSLGNTNRVRILQTLSSWTRPKKPSDIRELCGFSSKWDNTFEYHTDILEEAGLVESTNNEEYVLTNKGRTIAEKFVDLDAKDLDLEEIIGAGYNKALFIEAVSEPGKLLDIIERMREKKDFKTPTRKTSAKAPERKQSTALVKMGVIDREEKYTPNEKGAFYYDLISTVRALTERANSSENIDI